jgi:hypothetical protein
VLRSVIVVALLGQFARALAAEPSAIATIVEGKVVVIRALSKLEPVDGVRLVADDLVHTSKDGFLRIEYEDGTTVDVGADTRLQLNHPARRKFARPGLYLLSGWLKLTSGKSEARQSAAFGSPHLDVMNLDGAVVVHATPGSDAVFIEQGTASWSDRRTRAATTFALRAGEFLSFRRDEAPGLQDRPGTDFVAAVPHLFRDALPQRLARFRDVPVLAKYQGTFSYPEVEPWVNAELAIRHQFVYLWRSKAKIEEFRQPLERGLAMHPDWGPVLYPPEPKEAKGSLAAVSLSALLVSGPLAGSPTRLVSAFRH